MDISNMSSPLKIVKVTNETKLSLKIDSRYARYADNRKNLDILTTNLVTNYNDMSNKDSGLLPPVVRYFNSNYTGFLFEQPPFQLTLKYSFRGSHREYCDENDCPCHTLGKKENQILYKINIPWQVYIFNMSDNSFVTSVQAFFRNEAITSMDDKLYAIPLPNIYGSGRLCIGDLDELNQEVRKGTIENNYNNIFRNIVNNFWMNHFNNDLYDTSGSIPKSFYASNLDRDTVSADIIANKLLSEWEKLNLNEVMELNWIEHPTVKTIQLACDSLDGMVVQRSIGPKAEKQMKIIAFKTYFERLFSNGN